MSSSEFAKLLLEQFQFAPTSGQAVLLQKLAIFCQEEQGSGIFVLKGYAGTGKTTLVSTLIKCLPAISKKSVLLAPTGRAAKVLSTYSGKPAFTIHKKIYRLNQGSDGSARFVRQPNLHTNSIFLVDEASMIAAGGGLSGSFGDSGSLLDDLVHYVESGINCKLILIGDTAQLPPVGLSISPALDIEHLRHGFSLPIESMELKEVVRQFADSGILYNATIIRDLVEKGSTDCPRFTLRGFKDIVRLEGADLEDALNSAYGNFGVEGTAVICRSNKRANQFNQQIRARIRWQESELSAGDYMMVVKNNYHWLPESSSAGFIANGDMIELLKVGNIKELYGFRFVDARIRMVDYPNEPPLEVKLLLDTIASESPSLSNEQNSQLYHAVMEDYADIGDKRKRMVEVKKNPYFNALQVKFSYAITCHKAQGGQWETVFVDQGYLKDEMINTDFLRWLYTAVTRATLKLYLVNFNASFYVE